MNFSDDTSRDIVLDLYNNKYVSINVHQYDIDSRKIYVTITNKGKAYKVDNNVTVRVKYLKSDGNKAFNDCVILDDGRVLIEVTEQMAITPGKNEVELLLIDSSSGQIIHTMHFYANVIKSVFRDDEISSNNEFVALENALIKVDGLNKELEDTIANANVVTAELHDVVNNAEQNEGIRQQNELTRESSEKVRNESEDKRNTDEEVRKENEAVRINNENDRNSNEDIRKTSESIRESNELERQSGYAIMRESVNNFSQSLSDEITRATDAESTLSTNLNTEVTRAKNAENSLALNKLDKTTVATSSTLGLVKSGTDIMVDSSGNVSVNDNSHKHTVSNISDLTATVSELNYVGGVTSNIQTQLNSKSVTGHTHDDRYYTESEIDSKLNAKLNTSLKGSASGLAELDSNGKVPSSQLPSFVDDVIEGYLSSGKFYKESAHTTEISGETGKIYIDLSTGKTYRWSGSAFVVVSETLALGETSSTAYRGDRGKTAYDHSQAAHAPSNAQENVIETVKVNGTTITPSSKAVDITVPSVGNGTITITQAGTTKGSFTMNQSGNTTIELTDNNTTYSAGTGISLSGTTFSNSGVRSIASGSSNGTISVNTNGTSADVAVKGLGTAAYTGKTTASAKTHTNYNTNGEYVPSMNFLSYWNGAYNSSGNSNLSYCNQGAFGSIVTKSTSDYATISHEHNYAGSASAGGSATSAVKLDSSDGSSTQPVYFSNGKPVACTYTLGKSVPSDAVFTDTNTHYASGTIVNSSSSAISNTSTALSNGNVYLNHVENGNVTTSHKISGSGATSVTSDASGNIVVSSTNTVYSHPTTSGNKHIPSGGSEGQILKWSADGTAEWGDNVGGSSTDENVTQMNTTGNANFRVLFSGSANDTTTTEGARKNSELTFNPATGLLTAPKLKGILNNSSTVEFKSGDSTTATSWTSVSTLSSGLSLANIFNRISTMFKNIRYLYNQVTELQTYKHSYKTFGKLALTNGGVVLSNSDIGVPDGATIVNIQATNIYDTSATNNLYVFYTIQVTSTGINLYARTNAGKAEVPSTVSLFLDVTYTV